MGNLVNIVLPLLTAVGICFGKFDGLVAVGTVVVTEVIIKLLFKKTKPETWDAVMKLSPIVLSIATYVVWSFISKDGQWANAILKGIVVGYAAQKSYDNLFKMFIDWVKNLFNASGEAIKDLDEKARKELEKPENK